MHKSVSTLYSSHYVDSRPVISEVPRMLTHLLTDDLVVETQIAGGGSADLSSSIWAKKKDIKKVEWLQTVSYDPKNDHGEYWGYYSDFLTLKNAIQHSFSFK